MINLSRKNPFPYTTAPPRLPYGITCKCSRSHLTGSCPYPIEWGDRDHRIRMVLIQHLPYRTTWNKEKLDAITAQVIAAYERENWAAEGRQ